MVPFVLALVPVAFTLSLALTGVVVRLSARAGAWDTDAVPGQAKAERRRVPNTGGIGVFWAIAGPLGLGVAAAWALPAIAPGLIPEAAAAHIDGARDRTPLALLALGLAASVHGLGLIDDRRPLGPRVKLGVLVLPGLVLATLGGTRLIEAADGYVGGAWLSVALTALWFAAVINAMNFIDNMDGLCAGVVSVAGAAFLAAALLAGQWFVGGVLALVVGASAGFLVWNFPRARIFLGDSGSLALGFWLAFLTVRTTYVGESPAGEPLAGGWYAVLMPLVVLAVPLYDMVAVTAIRLRQGRSPMVGDLQHVSHRLVKRGLSRRDAVIALWGLTGVTAISGVQLVRAEAAWVALVIGAQVGLLLCVVALLEWSSSPPGAARDSLEPRREPAVLARGPGDPIGAGEERP